VRFFPALVALLLALGATHPAAALASPSARSVKIGVLTLGTLEALHGPAWPYFVQRLRDDGYVEGQTLTFDVRSADGDATRLPGMAQELVDDEPDAILALFTPAVLAAKQATSTIPVVIPFGGDPVGAGLVESLDHPGGNVTGMSDLSSGLMPTLVRVLNQTVPERHRIAIFTPASNPAVLPGLQASQAVSQELGIDILRVDVATPSDDGLDAAFDTAGDQGADAFVFYFTPTTPELDRHAAAAAAQRHLPGIYETRGSVDAGGLMSDSVDYNDSFARAADYIVQVLDGANPADLAIGVPRHFDLVINLSAARSLGVTIPRPLLDQAMAIIQ
jgi:putative tryptophan/tyrosine transport system substrate-binding protein